MNKYEKGKVVKGLITGLEPYGIFVNLDNYYTGLIHISEISTSFVKNISDYGKIGETIYAKIIDVNTNENRVKLSIKNIDYRSSKKGSSKKLIEETGKGFTLLGENLESWIKQKIEELT